MEVLVKVGMWGGGSDDLRDIAVAPHRLESVVVCSGWTVDSVSFTYTALDGTKHEVGPWGGEKHEVKLGETEVIKEVSGTYGPFEELPCAVRSLTLVTKHGPFGRAHEGTPFTLPVHDAARVVGFFGRSGRLLTALGLYVHP